MIQSGGGSEREERQTGSPAAESPSAILPRLVGHFSLESASLDFRRRVPEVMAKVADHVTNSCRTIAESCKKSVAKIGGGVGFQLGRCQGNACDERNHGDATIRPENGEPENGDESQLPSEGRHNHHGIMNLTTIM